MILAKENVEEIQDSIQIFENYACGEYESSYLNLLKNELQLLKDEKEMKRENIFFFKKNSNIACPISHIKVEILGNYQQKIGIKEDGFVKEAQYLNKVEYVFEEPEYTLQSMKDTQTKKYHLFFGYDYLSKNKNQRFILPPPISESGQLMDPKSFIESEISLFMNSPQIFKIKDEEKVKLQSIFIVTPNSKTLFGFSPIITYEQRGFDTLYSFELEEKIVLPKDCLIAIRLFYHSEDQRKMRLKLLGKSIYPIKN